MGQKPNGQTAPLDSRIAATLASDEVNKAELTSLLDEAHEALGMVQAVIEAETPRLHDLSNTDPDASLDLINRSKLRVERLEIAIPKLRNRIKTIEAYEYAQRYHASADALNARGIAAAERLQVYQEMVEELQDVYVEIDAIKSEIVALHARAPYGESRRLLDPELVARGIDHYDAAHPPLRELLRLPKWDRSSEVAFPPDPMATWNAHAALANEAYRERMAEKFGLSHSSDWAAARDLAVEHEEAEFAKRDAELKQQELERKAAYEAGLKQQGR